MAGIVRSRIRSGLRPGGPSRAVPSCAGLAPFFLGKGIPSMPTPSERPNPVLLPQFCKGCGRCLEACAKHCIELGTEINPETGLIPVVLHLEDCTACGLCMRACPEPYGLHPEP